MKTPTSLLGVQAPDPQLGLEFDTLEIIRSEKLLELQGINARLSSENKFCFTRINPTTPLKLVSLARCDKGYETPLSSEVYEKLVALPAEVEQQPLCLWAIDAILAQTDVTKLLQDRPYPKLKLKILTYGKFNLLGGDSYNGHIVFEENPDGSGFTIQGISYYNVFLLYPEPEWDVVALCAPTSMCS